MLRKLVSLLSLLVVTALVGGPALAARTAPLYNPEPIAVPAGKNGDQVKSAVRRALLQRNWRVKEIAPGHIEGRHEKAGRKGVEHVAIVTVKFDTKTVRISYKDSEELNYDKESGEIHPTYNKWVRNLEKDISVNLETL